jgi:hypothetical protein
MLFKPEHIKPDEKWDTTLNRGRGDCRLLKFKGFVASVPRLLKLIVDQNLVYNANGPLQHLCWLCVQIRIETGT